MGKIKNPPSDIRYPYPKAVGHGLSIAKVIGRAMEKEHFSKWGDYMRVLDLVKFEDGHREIRFCQYYRKAGGKNNDWIFGQGAGHMKIGTFYKLIHKAITNPDHGTFDNVFDKLKNKKLIEK